MRHFLSQRTGVSLRRRIGQTIPRNRLNHRWDEAAYILHEKGDFTRQYAVFKWRNAFTISLRELPDVLQREHPLLFFTLGYLLLMQMGMCAQWPPSSYEASGFSRDTTRLSFNVSALREWAARYRVNVQTGTSDEKNEECGHLVPTS